MAYDSPVASYSDPTLKQNRDIQPGHRGYSGVKPSLTTALSGANNDLVITAKNAGIASDPTIYVQYAVLGNNAPSWLYEGGYPAQLIPTTNLGFQLIAKFPGTTGNQFSITLVDPKVPA